MATRLVVNDNIFSRLWVGDTAPPTGATYDMWYDTTVEQWKKYNGAAWENVYYQVTEQVNAKGNCTGNQTLDLSLGNVITATLTGAGIWTFSNVAPAGKCSTVTIILTNGGAFVITWAVPPKWPDATPPTLAAAGVDILILQTVDGGTTWYGTFLPNMG